MHRFRHLFVKSRSLTSLVEFIQSFNNNQLDSSEYDSNSVSLGMNLERERERERFCTQFAACRS